MNERAMNLIEQGYSERQMRDFEEASDDQIVRSALDDTFLLATELGGRDDVTAEEATERVQEINLQIQHVIHTTAELKGALPGLDPEEDDPVEVSGVYAFFNGITLHVDSEDVFTPQYSVNLLIDAEGEYVTIDRLTGSKERVHCTIVEQYVNVADVAVNFHEISPRRARAWLEVSSPDTLQWLDSMLIPSVVETPEAIQEVQTDEQLLLNLGSVRFDEREETHSHYRDMLNTCMFEYVQAMSVLDTDAPYLAAFEGAVWEYDGDDQYIIEYDDETPMELFAVKGLVAHPAHDMEGHKELCLEGALLTDDALDTPAEVVVPISSIASLQSVRRLVYETAQDL